MKIGQNLAMCAWTFSALKILNPKLMVELGRHCRERVSTLFPVVNLSWVASSFAKLNVHDEVTFYFFVIHCCVTLLREMWVLIEQPLMKAIAEQAMGKESQFDTQSLSQLAWSFGTLGIKHPMLFIRLAQHAVTRIHEFAPQAFVNFAWAFSALDAHIDLAPIPYVKSTSTTEPASTDSKDRKDEAASSVVSNSLATTFLSALSRGALNKMGKMSRQGLTSFALAMAKMAPRDLVLLQQLESAIVNS